LFTTTQISSCARATTIILAQSFIFVKTRKTLLVSAIGSLPQVLDDKKRFTQSLETGALPEDVKAAARIKSEADKFCLSDSVLFNLWCQSRCAAAYSPIQ
jgi:hypothetical protein